MAIVTPSEPSLTRERHREGVARALEAVGLAGDEMLKGEAVLAASALRQAADALAAVIGVTGREEIFDRVFAGFCIGK
jgi:tRNA modification GTPase